MIHLIETTSELEDFCQHLSLQEFITVDLEFLREKTYYADLCLIQIGTLEQAAIVDPMAPGLDMSAFFGILDNPHIVKVFHSCRQDIEILYNHTGKIPAAIFDTQLAAMVCGFGDSASYENLVKNILHIELDKSCRFTNWSNRPLDTKQLKYALCDVTHLVHIYQYLRAELDKSGRESWYEAELQVLMNPATYTTNPDEAWQRIKHHSHNAYYLTVLKELAAWRENRAQTKNTPRQSLIKDECLLNIAAICPQTVEELGQIRNIRSDVTKGKLATEILDVLEKCRQMAQEDYVVPPKDKSSNHGTSALLELLKLLLKIKCQEQGVVAKLIADDDDLKRIAAGKDKGIAALEGWRYEIFGQDAIELRNGKLSISFDPEHKNIIISKS